VDTVGQIHGSHGIVLGLGARQIKGLEHIDGIGIGRCQEFVTGAMEQDMG
jgi:hypothetical protein